MIAAQRRKIILDAVEMGRFIRVRDAVALTGASQATIQRDFGELEASGLVRRHRGGIERAPIERSGNPDPESGGHDPAAGSGRDALLTIPPLQSRLLIREQSKRLIAERAALLCEDGQTVFIDGGSTTFKVAELLLSRKIRVVTNSFAIARLLLERGAAEIIMLGGQIVRSSEVLVSYDDDPILDSYPPDIAYLGAQGVDRSGVSNSDERFARMERRVARMASRALLVADSSKFGVRGRITVFRLDQIDTVVTDAGIPRDGEAMVLDAGCELQVVR
jgi:DeoR family ulaG and ulaABCDEF operon transcriptional repressor